MSAILLGLLLQVLPPPGPMPEAEVTVVANKLRRLQLNLAMAEGQLTGCAIKVSSRDKFIDGTACKATYACVRSGVIESRSLLDCINQRIVTAVAGQRVNSNEGRIARAQN